MCGGLFGAPKAAPVQQIDPATDNAASTEEARKRAARQKGSAIYRDPKTNLRLIDQREVDDLGYSRSGLFD
jgi:hypothetical protein